MVTVQVMKQSTGKPVKNARVHIIFDGFGRGISRKYPTDASGEAHLDCDPGKGKIYVNGDRKFDGDVSGRTVVYI